jgi:galactokinase
MVKHELSSGEYAVRRKQCEEGVAYFQQENPSIKALRDVSMKQIEAAKGRLPNLIYKRCHHVVTENRRTTEAAQLLGQSRYEQVGQLMVQSHNSLRDDYEVSVPELDFLVDESMKVKGVYGARMTGGGFGGCIVAIVQPRAVETLTTHLNMEYEKQWKKKPGIFATAAAAGVTVLE